MWRDLALAGVVASNALTFWGLVALARAPRGRPRLEFQTPEVWYPDSTARDDLEGLI